MNSDSQDQAHSNYIHAIAEARQNCREWVYRVERMPSIDPENSLMADKPQRELHSAVLDYYSFIQPFSDDLSQTWSEQLEHPETKEPIWFDNPVPGEDGLQLNEEAVKLYGFGDFFTLRTIEWTESVFDEEHGQISQSRQARVWIPPKVATAVYHQLNSCLKKLNLAADIEAVAGHDTPPEPPKHVRDSAPAYASGGDDE